MAIACWLLASYPVKTEVRQAQAGWYLWKGPPPSCLSGRAVQSTKSSSQMDQRQSNLEQSHGVAATDLVRLIEESFHLEG